MRADDANPEGRQIITPARRRPAAVPLTDLYNRSERAVSSRGSSPAARASARWVGGRSAGNRHSSPRPPARSTAVCHSFHQGIERRAMGSTTSTRAPCARASSSKASSRARPSGASSLAAYAASTAVPGTGVDGVPLLLSHFGRGDVGRESLGCGVETDDRSTSLPRWPTGDDRTLELPARLRRAPRLRPQLPCRSRDRRCL